MDVEKGGPVGSNPQKKEKRGSLGKKKVDPASDLEKGGGDFRAGCTRDQRLDC